MKKNKAEQFWLRYGKLVAKDLPVILKTRIPSSTLSTWKKKNIYPRADEAFKIASAIGTTVEYLVSGRNVAAVCSDAGCARCQSL
jgi:hypothetical protein